MKEDTQLNLFDFDDIKTYKENSNIFSKNMKIKIDPELEKNFDFENKSIENTLKMLKQIPWRKSVYDKQHWGNWLHSLSPYVGRITPAFAHWLIKILTKEQDVILEPFSGIGTITLESDLLNRRSIGNDLNPYAYIISRAKLDRISKQKAISTLENLKLNTDKVNVDEISDFVKQYFHIDTLKEIYALKNEINKMIDNKQEGAYFLYGCLLGILHGNRPGYLSCWTGCIIPYPPRKKDHPKFNPKKDIAEYREVIPRMIAKVKRMFVDGVPIKSKGQILSEDARKLSIDTNSIDIIISSPPYYNTLDYVSANRLRLAIIGYDKDEREKLKSKLIQNKQQYINDMLEVGKEMKRVLKNKSYCVWILGDLNLPKGKFINTALEVGKAYEKELGFKMISIVDDKIPRNKSAHRNGVKNKLDRVIILENRNALLHFVRKKRPPKSPS